MYWISTAVEISFGGEDTPQELDVRFNGDYYAARRGRREGGYQLEPDEPEAFQVYTVQVNVGGPSGSGWVDWPQVLWTDALERQLQQIGIASRRDEIERAAELRAEMAREERMMARRAPAAAE